MFSEACGTDPSDATFCPVTAPGRTWRPNSREAIGNDKTFRLQTDNACPINAGRSASESGKRVLQPKSGKKPEALSRHNDRNIRKSAQRFFPNRNESTVKSSPASLSPRKRRATARTPSNRTDRNRQRHAARRALGSRHFDRPDRSAPQIVGQHFDPCRRHAESPSR